MSATFDTLSFAGRLEQGGFTAEQARTLATEQAALLEQQLASKLDIARLEAQVEMSRAGLKQDIEQLRANVSREIERLRADVSREIEQLRADVSRHIGQLRADVARDVAALRTELIAKIEAATLTAHSELEIAKRELFVRIVGTLGAFIIAAVTIMGFLFRFLPHA